MFNLFKKKKDVDVKDADTKIDFTAEEALKNTLEKLYHPSYEQIKKDILSAIKRKETSIRYDAAYIDDDTKDKLSAERYYVFQSNYLHVPYFTIRWSKFI